LSAEYIQTANQCNMYTLILEGWCTGTTVHQ